MEQNQNKKINIDLIPMEVRKLCLNCTLKHLGQAIVLLGEVEKGYIEHKYIAMGHLAEAEEECMFGYPEIAKKIRETRLEIQEDEEESISIMDLIKMVHTAKEEDGDGCRVC